MFSLAMQKNWNFFLEHAEELNIIAVKKKNTYNTHVPHNTL